jgi:O-antigen/teichoic acid export membrane protein
VVLFAAIDGYQKSVLVGLEAMRAFATSAIVALGVGSPIVLIATNSFGLSGAAIGIVALAFIQAVVSRYQMTTALKRAGISRNAPGCLKELPVLWHFALPALLSGVLVGPVHWAAQAVLANTPNGYAELAVLGIAMQWFNLILFLPVTAGRVVLPILTDYVTKGDLANSRGIMWHAVFASAAVVLPLAVATSLLSPYVMRFYGQAYADDYPSLVLAVWVAALLAIQAPIGNILAAKSRMWLGASMNLGWAFVYLVFTFLLAKNGASGVLVALLLAYIAHAVWTFWFALHQTAG